MADKTMVDFTNKIKPYFKGVAPVEPTTTAAAAYSAGEQFYLDGTLVEALTSIAVGDTLTLNTNYKVVGPIETQLRQVKQALTDEAEARALLGAHNLFDIRTDKTTDTKNEVTITYNSDGTVTADISSTLAAGRDFEIIDANMILPSGTYKLTGCPSEGGSSAYELSVKYNNTWYRDYGSGVEITVDGTTPITNAEIVIRPNITAQTLVFKPMLRLATDIDSTFAPYAMTNQQLTEELAIKQDECTDIITGATAARKELYKTGKVISLSLTLSDVTCSIGDTICKIPDGYRPNIITEIMNNDSGGASVLAYVDTSGNVVSRRSISSEIIRCSAMWITA